MIYSTARAWSFGTIIALNTKAISTKDKKQERENLNLMGPLTKVIFSKGSFMAKASTTSLTAVKSILDHFLKISSKAPGP
jgi:hypothetical protein